MVKSIYGGQYYDGFIPELIVVVVTWANGEVLRSRDYMPNRGKVGNGTYRTDAFLDFMDNNYRVDNKQRSLIGCSLGGLVYLIHIIHALQYV